MKTNELRAEYLALRTAAGMPTKKFDASCHYMLADSGIDSAKASPAQWVSAAKDVLRWQSAKKAPVSGKCGRCGGLGVIPAFVGVNGGECFECN